MAAAARRDSIEGGRKRVASLLLGAALVLPAQQQVQPPPGAIEEPAWQPVWSDEFDTPGLPDSAKWSYDVGGHGWGNRELQFHTEARRENARIEDGRLIIEARRGDWQGKAYTSARLNSRASWTYGRIDVRAKLPRGRGTWPAIWMLPVRGEYGKGGWPDNGEIDIMEHVGFDPGVIHGTIHTRAYNHADRTQRGATIDVADAQDAFHVYWLQWTPRSIDVGVDKVKYFSFSNERLTGRGADWRQWPFDRDFRILLNVAVGGNWGGQKGVDENIWPQRLEIDYVRVSQLKR